LAQRLAKQETLLLLGQWRHRTGQDQVTQRSKLVGQLLD
jgi:hypothetical protein